MSGDDAGKVRVQRVDELISEFGLRNIIYSHDEGGVLTNNVIMRQALNAAFESGAAFAQGSPATTPLWEKCQWCETEVCLNPSDPTARLAVWNHLCLGKLTEINRQLAAAAQPERPGPPLPSCAGCGGNSRLMPVCQKCYSVVGGFKDGVAPQSAPGPLGTKQQRLSRQCEDCAAQIGIGTKLAGEYREAEAADLIYLFMRELFPEVTG
jgi:hypothetical protein